MRHSSHSVDDTIPAAQSKHSHAVVLKVSESESSSRKHLHLGVESFGDAVGFGEAPHDRNAFDDMAAGAQCGLAHSMHRRIRTLFRRNELVHQSGDRPEADYAASASVPLVLGSSD